MKIHHVLALSSLIVSVGSVSALAGEQNSSSKHQTSASDSSSSSEVRLSKLMDANIVSKSGENLGELQDLIVDPQTGKIKYAVLGRGGFLGLGEKYVPVPWKAIQLTSEKQFTLNVDKSKLKSAPTTDKNFGNLQQPGYDVTIYRFYEIPLDTGAAEGPGGTQQGGSSSSASTNHWNNSK